MTSVKFSSQTADSASSVYISLETAADSAEVAALIERVFGPAILTRAAHVLRGETTSVPQFTFVARRDDTIIGTVRLTPIRWGEREVLMLGPLGVDPLAKNMGVGRKLMKTVMDAARADQNAERWGAVMLVGDPPYYHPFGFRAVPHGKFEAPLPVDPMRVLVAELCEGGAEDLSGNARAL
ncbi:GNAT family N-acetyltransferase [Ahrensia sp. R2A130]|uniref:GNAT family N-acetyltransferase n=1 Tax=Ahrensia sp. R2A130 TaxID=744979 RepID=UPI0001E0F8A9|nr:N-acetyltransferase [Ahrensia sp. R2A130]EFL89046.1 acetyltransferase protein [Ahrensia sp. R2A130]